MNYEESVRALMALGRELAAPQQARVQKFALDNITTLAAALGDPHRSIPCVHIAGTNGKGSTAAMLESILRAAGLRTGLYTSPHLERINERIRIDGESVSDDVFAAAWTRIHATIESLMAAGKLAAHPTFFECVTAMAFLAFAESRVDLAIYEVGLGGRLDATNIIFPEVAIITPVDFDHESYLGHSIEEIAFEKAGIIKKDGCVVSSVSREEARAVIARRAQEMNARMIESDSTWRLENVTRSDGHYRAVAVSVKTKARLAIAPGLPGHFQLRNALAAATAAEILAARGYAVANIAIEQGIARARWPGRLERLARHPDIYLDGAHNPSAARELREFWDEEFANRDIYLVYGAMRDKAVDEIAGILFPRTKAVFLTQPQQPRAISANLLAEMTHGLAPDIYVVRDPTEALERAIQMARPNDAVFVSGSLYLVGELTSYWKSHRRE
ncbi:MAG: folylpolyglutamate synthase/dihydrofolate synthase family protein [Candidatus Acidiferrales bacterium]